ncbi:MAG: topoisomerase DNA-binding C4 zinc finger domain-containing protein [Succinivibrionaceae bacterium]
MNDKQSSVINVDDISEIKENSKSCPICGSALVLRNTRHGHILGCTNYPVCNYVENVVVQGVAVIRQIENKSCPECGSPLAVKKSRYGMFIGCLSYPQCSYIYTESSGPYISCPVCGEGVLRQNLNKYGKSFYYCSNFRNCSFKMNHRPVEHPCPECGFSVMELRKGKNGLYLQCPQRKCRHKIAYDDQE